MLSSKFSKRVSEARSARIAAESAALEAAREECAAAAKPPLKSSLKKSGGNQATPNAQAARAAIASKAAQALVPVLARGAVPPPSCCKRIRSKCCSGGCGGGRCSKCCDRSAGGAPEAVAAAAAAGRIREIRAVMEDSAVARDFAARSGPGEEAGTSCGSAMLAPCRAVQHTHSTNLLCSCTIFIATLHSLGRTVPLSSSPLQPLYQATQCCRSPTRKCSLPRCSSPCCAAKDGPEDRTEAILTRLGRASNFNFWVRHNERDTHRTLHCRPIAHLSARTLAAGTWLGQPRGGGSGGGVSRWLCTELDGARAPAQSHRRRRRPTPTLPRPLIAPSSLSHFLPPLAQRVASSQRRNHFHCIAKGAAALAAALPGATALRRCTGPCIITSLGDLCFSPCHTQQTGSRGE